MPIKIKSVPVGGGGGSAAPTLEGTWDYVVATEAELITALADADSRILFNDSFSLTADRALQAGTYTFGRAPGVVLSTGNFDLTATSPTTIKIIDPQWDMPGISPFINGGALVDSSANITLRGWYSQTVTVTQQGIRTLINVELDGLRLIGAVADIRALGVGRAERVILTGTNAAAYFQLYIGFGSLVLDGTYRADNAGALAIASNYSLHISNQLTYSELGCGPILCNSSTSQPAIYLSGSPGVRVGPVSTSQNFSYIPVVGGTGSWCLEGGYFTIVATANAYHVPKVFGGTGYDAIRVESSGTPIDFYEHRIATTTCTIAHRFFGGRIINAMVVSSGSKAQFYGVVLDEFGQLTLNSGAEVKMVGFKRLGSATFTNNDPLSVVRQSDNPLHNTQPEDRVFADSNGVQSAALNAYLPFIGTYWSGKTMPCPNQAPFPNGGGAISSVAGAVVSNGSAIDIDATTDLIQAACPQFVGQGDFQLTFTLDLDSNPGAEQNLLGLDAGSHIAINLLASRAIRLYLEGTPIADTTTGAVTTSGQYRVTWKRVAGTLKCLVNGTSVYSGADSTNVTQSNGFYLGTNGADATPGQYSNIFFMAGKGMSDADEDLLDTYTLRGAGI